MSEEEHDMSERERALLVAWLVADGFDRETARMEVDTYSREGFDALTDTPRDAVSRWIAERDPRDIAARWHDGQWSALYAYASTGSVSSALVWDIERDLERATTAENRIELGALLRAVVDAIGDAATGYARALGTDHGRAAASWVFDGNTSEETYRRVLAGIDDGDPEVLDTLPCADLSGEWADTLTGPQLIRDALADVLADFEDESDMEERFGPDICDAYVVAFGDAVVDAVERAAREHLAA